MFRFDDVPAGTHRLQARRRAYAVVDARVTITPADSRLALTLTALPLPRPYPTRPSPLLRVRLADQRDAKALAALPDFSIRDFVARTWGTLGEFEARASLPVTQQDVELRLDHRSATSEAVVYGLDLGAAGLFSGPVFGQLPVGYPLGFIEKPPCRVYLDNACVPYALLAHLAPADLSWARLVQSDWGGLSLLLYSRPATDPAR